MAWAINSLPVPVSPWINTAQSAGATIFTWSSTVRNFALLPIISRSPVFHMGSPSVLVGDLRQKPRPPLRLVDPHLNQAGSGHVVVFLADFVSCAQVAG